MAAQTANAMLYIIDGKVTSKPSSMDNSSINANPPSYNAVMNNNNMLPACSYSPNSINLDDNFSEQDYNTFTNVSMIQNGGCSDIGQCCGGGCGTSTCCHRSCGGRAGCRSNFNNACGMKRTGGCGSRCDGGYGSGYGGTRCGSGVVFKLIKSMIEAKREKKALRMGQTY
jgi:hypothetical protein